LTPIADPELIPSTIGQALGLRESRGASPLTLLKERLQSAARAPLLLLLDGFEHLLAAAPLVADVVAGAEGVKVLVTSRSPLHVYGEHEVPVPPLASPRPGELPPDELER